MTPGTTWAPLSEGGFTGPRDHLDAWLMRCTLLVQRYMRLHSDRLVQSGGSYTDACVGFGELRRMLGHDAGEDGDGWLDRLGVPAVDALTRRIAAVRASYNKRLSRTHSIVRLAAEDLRAGFALNDLELEAVMLAAGPRISIPLARLYTVAWADFTVKQATCGFLAEVLAPDTDDPGALFRDGAALVRHRLITPAPNDSWKPDTPRAHALAVVAQPVLAFLEGADPPEPVTAGVSLLRLEVALDALQLGDGVADALRAALQARPPRAVLCGPPSSGRRTATAAMVGELGQPLYQVDVPEVVRHREDQADLVLGEVLPGLLREARLYGATVLLRLGERLDLSGQLQSLLREFPGGILVAVEAETGPAQRLLGGAPVVRFDPPAREGQLTLWNAALDGKVPRTQRAALATNLAAAYRLPPGVIFAAADDARRTRRKPDMASLVAAVRHRLDDRLGWLAEPWVVEMSLDEVVLTDDVGAQLQEILRFARQRERVFEAWEFSKVAPGGSGLSVLFSGPPGTGKTLVAGALARKLGRAMYRVDLGRVVDKYIGETEKNLARIFDEAERSQAVLLFDEADALFARRTQVKSSNDRYANLEVNYLLQKLEAFNGMSVLTTNFATSIDEAFQRRIRFKVEFPLPEAEHRILLWKRLLPPAAPIGEVDWAKLAGKFELSGGHIKGAVLRAAVQAADAGEPINHKMLWDAAIAETREMGSLVLG